MDQAQTPSDTQLVPDNSVTPKKKSKLGLILGLSIGGGVLLIGILVTVLLLVLGGGISKQDYRDAADQIKKVGQTATDMSASSFYTSVLGGTVTQPAIDSIVSKFGDAQTKLRSEMETLSSMKAVKKDEDAKAKFDVLESTYKKYDQDISSSMKLLEEIGPTLVAMSKLSQQMVGFNISNINNVEPLTASLRDVADKGANVNTDDNNIDKTFAELSEVYGDFATALDQFAANPTQATTNALISASAKIKTKAALLQTAFTSFGSSSTKTAAEFTTAINALGKYLTNKANNK
ncbi:hypothetical protein FWC31_01415 [Candidatus Saccharibacteria bacterium]|nr:hypothetical protein [Candidatus Saccharibacteria bacterium]